MYLGGSYRGCIDFCSIRSGKLGGDKHKSNRPFKINND
jgi:hypothetical protein